MSSASKIKWSLSIILAAIMLTLALIGGNWGTTKASSQTEMVVPTIDYIEPSSVPSGSPYKILIIVGSNFNQCSVWVRLTGTGLDKALTPITILPDAISVLIDSSYFDQPQIYTLYVVSSTKCSIPPERPYWPPYDELSNPATLTVFQSFPMFLPLLHK